MATSKINSHLVTNIEQGKLLSAMELISYLYGLQCCFLIYCMAPTSWNGSVTIYNQVRHTIRHQQADTLWFKYMLDTLHCE